MLNFQDNEIRITYSGKLSANGNEIKFTREVGSCQRGNRGQARAGRVGHNCPSTTSPQSKAEPVVPQAITTNTFASVPAATPVLQIDFSKVTGKVSPMFYGLMTEEINFAYEGGIYAELIRNRSFKADANIPRVTPTLRGRKVPSC